MYSIESIHTCLLGMMKEFHKICTENNLRYYIVGGTCIGAMRHKGFIPWDDDVDIAMPRPDYDKLAKLDWNSISKKLEIKYYKNTKNCPIHYIKVVDKTTTLIEERYHNYIEGLYLDIFPLDGVEPKDNKIKKKIWTLHSIVMKHCSTSDKDKGIKTLIAKVMPLSFVHKLLEVEMAKYSYDKSDCVINYLGAYGNKEMVPKAIFGTPKLYEFEGDQFYGPEKCDKYLKQIYGEYMVLPPIECRVFKHNYYYINLNKPYRSWKKENQ